MHAFIFKLCYLGILDVREIGNALFLFVFLFLDSGSTKPPLRFKTSSQSTSTVRYTSLSDPSSDLELTTNSKPPHHPEYHPQHKRSNTKFFITDKSDPVYTSSNWTFPWDSSSMSKSTLTNNHPSKTSKSLLDGNNGLLLDDDRILKQLVEETKSPVVFLSENNTVINAHSGTSVTLPCIIKKESKFEVVSKNSNSLDIL